MGSLFDAAAPQLAWVKPSRGHRLQGTQHCAKYRTQGEGGSSNGTAHAVMWDEGRSWALGLRLRGPCCLALQLPLFRVPNRYARAPCVQTNTTASAVTKAHSYSHGFSSQTARTPAFAGGRHTHQRQLTLWQLCSTPLLAASWRARCAPAHYPIPQSTQVHPAGGAAVRRLPSRWGKGARQPVTAAIKVAASPDQHCAVIDILM